MFEISTKVVSRPPDAARIMKYIGNGTAIGITRTLVEAKTAVIGEWEGKFTIRGQWLRNAPIGPKVKPANGDTLTGSLEMTAKFARLQETGGTKIPFGNHLAIPTQNARPNPGARIPARFMPKALVATGKAFIEKFKNGTMALSVHGLKKSGKFGDVVVMYFLVPKAQIKPAHIWEKPITGVVTHRLALNIDKGIEQQLALLATRS